MLNRANFIQRFWWVVAVLLAISYPAQADLIFTSPPREGGGGSNTKADDIYDPLASYLSKILGQKVVYENPGNWFNYQRQMREDKYDIVFDGPHFISWRIEHVQHEAIARMPGPLGFVLLARADDTEINKIDDLIAQSICGVPPPNLGTMAILDKFRNPVRQPVVKSIPGAVPQVFAAFLKGQCRAVAVPTFFEKKLKDDERKQIKVIFRSAVFPNQGFSVSKRIGERERELLRQALTGTPDITVQNLIKRFGKADDHLVATTNKEFEGFNNLLEGVIYGW
jgi:ABC transporter, phosphonate, periplasmic substrate-binding protein